MRKVLRIVVAFLLLSTVIFALGTFDSFAYTDKFDENVLEEKITDVYTDIRNARGYSYKGYCGTFIIDQLKALKIGYLSNGGSLNGNKWFVNLKSGVTSYGYTQIKYEGNNCLYDIVEANEGCAVYNIVISFTYQLGYSYEKPGAGHALLIYAISDGYVYFTENFTFDGIKEGGMIKLSLIDFYERFNADYGVAIGAVHFVNKEKELTDKIEAVYAEVNNMCSDDGESLGFVNGQLDVLEIGYVINSGSDENGGLYSALEKWGLTENSYIQRKFEGDTALCDIMECVEASELRDIVVSFGNADEGHSVYIYGMLGDHLYFVEDSEHFGYDAGQAIKMTVEDFCRSYTEIYGAMSGAVQFVKTDSEGYVTVKNVGAGRLLNIYDDRDVEGTSVTVYRSDKTTGQYFRFEFDGVGFKLYSLCAPEKAVGLNDSNKAIITNNIDDCSWLIEKVSGGYLIRLASDPQKVLASSGNYNSARVVVADYVEGNRFQLWTFSDNELEKALKCYKVTFNSDGKSREVYCSYGEIPMAPRTTDYVTNEGISYFDSWDRDLSPVTSDCTYTAQYRFVSVEYEISWNTGNGVIVETVDCGCIPVYADNVMYDRLPTAVYCDAEYKVYHCEADENGKRFYFGDEMLMGWHVLNGEKRYFSKVSGYMITKPTTIEGVRYYFN
ncbi:MAG: hypothetical protein E7675_08655, partial [Ruminococcaceae bacterium]|nr:hypothetical protein [Oscillospiraceae bacterium]